MNKKIRAIAAGAVLAGLPISALTSPLLDLNAIGATATASASYSNDKPALAIDGDLATLWNGGSRGPHWLEVNLGRVYDIDRIALYSADGPYYSANYYVNYQLFGSLDGSSWGTALFSGRLADGPAPAYYDDVTLTTTLAMQYVRFEVPSGTHWSHLYEIELYGAPAGSDTAGLERPMSAPGVWSLMLAGVLASTFRRNRRA